MSDTVNGSDRLPTLDSRPKSLKIGENNVLFRNLPRPKLHFKRFSSPLGSLGVENKSSDSRLTPPRAPSPDIGRRHTGLSRRHYYGSLETLHTMHSTNDTNNNAGKFRIENGEIGGQQNGLGSRQGSVVHLENPEFQTRWYFKYFLGKVHQNYIGMDSSKDPFLLSLCLTDADNYGVPQYRAILWRKTGSQKLCIPYSPSKPISAKVILHSFTIKKTERGPKEVLNPEIQKELLVLEEQEGSINFKFGVLYAKNGQLADDEMFGNERGSKEFNDFLALLGDRIKLRGWDKYRGGLDTKNDMTGSESVFTVYEGHEIMFHVSTFLPFTPDNTQQLERKRHIGNDIVTIVFQDCGEGEKRSTFVPVGVKSKFIHVYAHVTYDKSEDSYKLTVYSEKNVPIFGPPLPCPPVFHNHQEFRDFLLIKLMNGEKAAYLSPTFSNRRQRTLDSLLTRLIQDHMNEKLGFRKSWGDVIDAPRAPRRRKESEREHLFLQFGQSLKLKTIVKGDAPTSLISTASSGNAKVEPWQHQCVFEDFPRKIICGDSWGESLVLGTEEGICVLRGGKVRNIFDKSVSARQITVVEAYDLLLFRLEKGKDSRIHAFRLTDFEDEEEPLKSKDDCKAHRLEKTKGCHLFTVSRSGGSHLRVAVAVGKRILLLRWKHSVVWSTWAVSGKIQDVAAGFEVVKEVTAPDAPILMTLVDTSLGTQQHSSHENLLCVGYRHHFDLITESGETTRVHSVDTQKKTLNMVSVLDVYEEEEPELLISFNHQSIFKRLTGEQSSNFSFHWNSQPHAVVCAFPYLLAFTRNTVEIRLVVNSNLVHTMVLPQINLITSKSDIYFTACPPKSPNSAASDVVIPSSTGRPPSPCTSEANSYNVYRISLFALAGQFADPLPVVKIPECVPIPPQFLVHNSAGSSGESYVSSARRVSFDDRQQNNAVEDKASQSKEPAARTNSSPLPSPRLERSTSLASSPRDERAEVAVSPQDERAEVTMTPRNERAEVSLSPISPSGTFDLLSSETKMEIRMGRAPSTPV